MAHWYSILGGTLRSDLELPEAIPIEEPRSPADFRISLGPIDYDKSSAAPVTHRSYINQETEYLLEIEDVAKFKVAEEGRITIAIEDRADPADVRAYLLGTVLTSLCYRRDLIPLHASCVRLPRGAVAVTGSSGAGKSTLAACLAGQEHAVISDDTCAVDLSHDQLFVLPTVSRIKLWPTSLGIVGVDHRHSNRSDGMGKFHFHKLNDAEPIVSASPLAAIFVLEKVEGIEKPELSRISDPKEAIGVLLSHLPRMKIISAMNLNQAIIEKISRIATTVPVYSLHRPSHAEEAQDLAAMVKSALEPSR